VIGVNPRNEDAEYLEQIGKQTEDKIFTDKKQFLYEMLIIFN
jgi:hypothetical protein